MAWFKRICIVLVAVSIIGGCVQQNGEVVRQLQFPELERGVLNVLTFNIRYGTADDGPDSWDYRKEMVVDVLAGFRSDVIGLQEALDFQVGYIQRALPQYRIVWVGRDDGELAGEACPILYRSDRFSLVDSGTFWFSNSPWKVASKHWGNNIPRICTWVHLKEIATGEAFYVYNLHLDHQSQTSRVKSTELLAKEIAHRPTDDPFIVMGDFNMGLDNPAMLYLQEIGYESPCPRMVDSWQMLNRMREPVGTFHGFNGEPETTKIDHILVMDNTEIIEVGIDPRDFGGRYPSDHFPVYAQIVLSR